MRIGRAAGNPGQPHRLRRLGRSGNSVRPLPRSRQVNPTRRAADTAAPHALVGKDGSHMHRVSTPHVSDAVRQLRMWVTIAATLLGVCCGVQMLTYAFAAYTDSRFEEVRTVKADKPLRVVVASAPEPAPAHDESGVVGGVRTTQVENGKAAAETTRVHSATDAVLKRSSDIACGVGVISAVMLAILTILGVAVAGGASIPGVERVTTACVWSLVLALLCLPWQRVMPGLGVPGIFAAYADMTTTIDTKAIGSSTFGSLALFMQWIAAPLAAMFTAMGVGLWFRAGVERGIIVTSPSQLDRAVEREVELIQKRGVASSAPKSVGALHQAIGSTGESESSHRGAPPGTLSAVERALNEAAAIATSAAHPEEPGITRRRIPRTVADADFKRPI